MHASPTRSAVFNSGKTSRIHVAHFMADLITGDETWRRWRGQMPVIYNKGFSQRMAAAELRTRGHTSHSLSNNASGLVSLLRAPLAALLQTPPESLPRSCGDRPAQPVGQAGAGPAP